MSDRIQAVAVVVNGTIRDATWTKERIMNCDYVIGVDGGNNYLHRMGIVPDLIIGDLDSIAEETRIFFTDRGCSFMTFPAAKDQSDLQLSLEHAASLHPDRIHLWGALGKRFDHAYGNVLLLSRMADQGVRVVIEDEDHEIQVITARKEYQNMAGDVLSLFSLTPETTGVVTRGMAYPLCRETLYQGDTRGLSNIIKDPEASVSLESGKLLAIRIRHESSDQ